MPELNARDYNGHVPDDDDDDMTPGERLAYLRGCVDMAGRIADLQMDRLAAITAQKDAQPV